MSRVFRFNQLEPDEMCVFMPLKRGETAESYNKRKHDLYPSVSYNNYVCIRAGAKGYAYEERMIMPKSITAVLHKKTNEHDNYYYDVTTNTQLIGTVDSIMGNKPITTVYINNEHFIFDSGDIGAIVKKTNGNTTQKNTTVDPLGATNSDGNPILPTSYGGGKKSRRRVRRQKNRRTRSRK